MTVGGLIFPSKVTLGILEPDLIRSNSEYDDEFRELVVTDSDGDGIGEENRRERTVITEAQIATRTLDRFFQAEHGQSPETRDLELTFHFRGLRAAGLVAAGGRSVIIIGTRLIEIKDRGGDSIIDFPDPPGMYCTGARPSGFLGTTRNLWVCTFAERRQSINEPARVQI